MIQCTKLWNVCPFYNINIKICPLQNRRLSRAAIIFTLIFFIFLKSQRLFLNWSSYYLELSLTILQNYSLCESLIHSFDIPKSEKTTTIKQIEKSLKSIIDIFIGNLTGWVRFIVPGTFGPQRQQQICLAAKSCKNIQSKTKKQNKEAKSKNIQT